MDTLQICEAKSKQSGERCKNFASKGKPVCRIHGGRSSGARSAVGKDNQKKASWKHGLRSKEVLKENRGINEFIKECKRTLSGG